MVTSATRYQVEVTPDANGVAGILGSLLGENFTNFENRDRIARRMRKPVAVYSVDTDESTTVTFGDARASLDNGIVGKPTVTVKATVEQILAVSELKMKAGGLVPVGFFTKRGLGVLGQIARHRLVVKGLIKHPLTSLRFIALVSIVG
ncbi:MAG TPA: hypothetical protein VKJ83_08955 [Actinomycetota bacterium]|nr:hypothetical protein [Actinomycetota bacterium]